VTNEIAVFGPLLAGLDLAGVLITVDARYTKRDHARFLVADKHADYLLVVKANQPALHAQLAALPWRAIPVMDRTRDHARGRIELRTLKVASLPAWRSRTPPKPSRSRAVSATPPAAAGEP
jgi:predicted transposase YbfD/YdcC